MPVEVTVALSAYRAEPYIRGALSAILDQTVDEFELVIVEDFPPDGTRAIVEEFDDERIRYTTSLTHLGIAGNRNLCVKLAKSKYVFFTDDDCIVSRNWIEKGLESFRKYGCIAVEGRTYYVSEDYRPTFSDNVIQNRTGGQFMAGNMAYEKKIVEQLGGFDERYTYLEDRDLGLRASKYGRINFNADMIVFHRKVTLTPAEYVNKAKAISNRILLYKKFGERPSALWRITSPLNLLTIIFPPLVFARLLRYRFATNQDFALLPFIYPRLLYERIILWHTCARERVFMI